MNIAGVDRLKVQTRHSLDYYKQRYEGEEAVYDIVDETIEDYSDFTDYRTYGERRPYLHGRHARIVVLDSSFWRHHDRFSVEYPAWKTITNFLLLINDADGAVHSYEIDKLRTSKTRDGGNTYTFIYPRLKPGSIIDCYTESTVRDRIGGEGLNISQSLACDSLHLRLVCDKTRDLRWKRTIQDLDSKVLKVPTESKTTTLYEYSESQVPAVYNEYYSEPRTTRVRSLQPRYDEEYISWNQPRLEQFHDYYSKSLAKGSLLRNDTLVTMSMNLAKNCSTTKQTIDSILTWVQNNIRVDGTGYTDGTESMTSVLGEKFGSPALITGLTKTLLEIANVKSDYLVVRTFGFGPFDTRFIYRNEFVTPALRVSTDKDSTFLLFPSLKGVPYNEIPWWLEDRAVLVDSDADSTRFITFTKSNVCYNSVNVNYTISLNADSSANIIYDGAFGGMSARNLRQEVLQAKKFTDREVRDALVDNIDVPWTLSESEREGVLKEYDNLYDPHQPFAVRLKFKIANLFACTDISKRTAPFQRLLCPDFSSDSGIHNGKRHVPIYVRYPVDYTVKIDTRIPETWRHTALSDQRKSQSALGQTTVDIDADATGFKLTRHQILKAGVYDANLSTKLYEALCPSSEVNHITTELIRRK